MPNAQKRSNSWHGKYYHFIVKCALRGDFGSPFHGVRPNLAGSCVLLPIAAGASEVLLAHLGWVNNASIDREFAGHYYEVDTPHNISLNRAGTERFRGAPRNIPHHHPWETLVGRSRLHDNYRWARLGVQCSNAV